MAERLELAVRENLERLRANVGEFIMVELRGLAWGIAAIVDDVIRDNLIRGAYGDAYEGFGISPVRRRALKLLSPAEQSEAQREAVLGGQERYKNSPMCLIEKSRSDRLAITDPLLPYGGLMRHG